MERRVFIQALACATAVLPIPAWAQEGRRTRIGMLIPANPAPFLREFREAMRGLGYVEGRDFELEFRSADGDPRRLPALAAELLNLKVDIFVAAQTPAVAALKQVTKEIPIVMATAGDPVATGLVASLARPGGNITGSSGTTAEMGGKLLEFILEMLPGTNRIAVLINPADIFTKSFLAQIEAASHALKIAIHPIGIHREDDFAAAFEQAATLKMNAVIVQPSLPRRPAIGLALKHRLPTISPSSLFGREGGLLSYSPDQIALYRRGAVFVDRILKGAKPADIPVEQPTKFELIVNLRTAKLLDVTVPTTLIARADEVIE